MSVEDAADASDVAGTRVIRRDGHDVADAPAADGSGPVEEGVAHLRAGLVLAGVIDPPHLVGRDGAPGDLGGRELVVVVDALPAGAARIHVLEGHAIDEIDAPAVGALVIRVDVALRVGVRQEGHELAGHVRAIVLGEEDGLARLRGVRGGRDGHARLEPPGLDVEREGLQAPDALKAGVVLGARVDAVLARRVHEDDAEPPVEASRLSSKVDQMDARGDVAARVGVGAPVGVLEPAEVVGMQEGLADPDRPVAQDGVVGEHDFRWAPGGTLQLGRRRLRQHDLVGRRGRQGGRWPAPRTTHRGLV